ncbi:hypothetical protein CLOM_g17323 [Closterium sp. NIES-68]|nr:hypothetical protein CLOM_g17323 [Closterium sp. NIES-68]GJP73144.1 hypothetical protein CLOP_g3884 [Closterium sp. NIES-67]
MWQKLAASQADWGQQLEALDHRCMSREEEVNGLRIASEERRAAEATVRKDVRERQVRWGCLEVVSEELDELRQAKEVSL